MRIVALPFLKGVSYFWFSSFSCHIIDFRGSLLCCVHTNEIIILPREPETFKLVAIKYIHRGHCVDQDQNQRQDQAVHD